MPIHFICWIVSVEIRCFTCFLWKIPQYFNFIIKIQTNITKTKSHYFIFTNLLFLNLFDYQIVQLCTEEIWGIFSVDKNDRRRVNMIKLGCFDNLLEEQENNMPIQ